MRTIAEQVAQTLALAHAKAHAIRPARVIVIELAPVVAQDLPGDNQTGILSNQIGYAYC